MIQYHGKTFRPVDQTANSETSTQTVFRYCQDGDIVTCSYAGGRIRSGHLIGIVDKSGQIDMRYHQVNDAGQLMTGVCRSVPEILSDGRIRLYESWQWTSGDLSKGNSVLEEER